MSVRAHPGIRGVNGGDNGHTLLLLYVDDILAVVSEPLPSLPHQMDTIQSLTCQRDLGGEIKSDRWAVILADCGKYMRVARGRLAQYKVFHRYYYTPSRLCRMKLLGDDLCWKCKEDTGTFLHCMWECVLIGNFLDSDSKYFQ